VIFSVWVDASNATLAAATAADSAQSLALLLSTIAVAVKQIAGKVSRAGLEGLFGVAEQQGGGSGDTQKKLDVIAVSMQEIAWWLLIEIGE
jgi:fructose-1,6-bisphosphatase